MNHTGRRIGELRKLQGWALQVLADRAGLTKGYLSKIEHAPAPPPFTTLEKLAGALDVDVNDLLPTGPAEAGDRNIDFLPAVSKRRSPFRTDGVYSFKPLLKSYRNKQMSPFFMSLQPGKTKTFKHDAEEFVYILAGKVTMRYDGRVYSLQAGDCFYLDSRIGHTFLNQSGAEVQLLAVNYNYRRF